MQDSNALKNQRSDNPLPYRSARPSRPGSKNHRHGGEYARFCLSDVILSTGVSSLI